MHAARFVKLLRIWNQENPREMPWSNIKDPYKIWVSEVILQQTRVAQGWDYYLNFINCFPNVKSLAEAEEDYILKQWEGLGYYSRARNMHKAANQIMELHSGKFPNTYEEIIALSGIGPYTAAAISSFAFQLSHPVLDGNVVRVMSRYFSISEDVLKNSTKKEILKILETLIVKYGNPAEFNQAMMNFGALQCVPKSPNCEACEMRKLCGAYHENLVAILPYKAKKIKKRNRYFHYFDFVDKNSNHVITKREGNDIWKGLYEFVKLENTSDQNLSLLEIKEHSKDLIVFTKRQKIDVICSEFKHALTHQTIIATVYTIYCTKLKPKKPNLILTNSVEEYAFPRLLDLYLHSK